MLATEEPTAPVDDPAPRRRLLETMVRTTSACATSRRSVDVQKLDGDLRRRIEKLLAALLRRCRRTIRGTPRSSTSFARVCRAIDRVADVARPPRGNHHPPADLANRISWSIGHAVTNLKAGDADTSAGASR